MNTNQGYVHPYHINIIRNGCPSFVCVYLQQDVNHTVSQPDYHSYIFSWYGPACAKPWLFCCLFLSFQKREVSPLTFSEEATNQVHADCVRTSVPARPPVTLPVDSQLHRPTDLTTENKRLDITLTLWDCLRPFFLPFLFLWCLCGLLSSLSPQSRGERSIIKIVTGSRSGIVRKPTSVGDMLNSGCEKHCTSCPSC